MQVYSLEIDDFSSVDYTLIGIHTTLEDYHLAFLINTLLHTKFRRALYDLDFKNKNNNATYAVYEYSNPKQAFDWFLIANVYKKQTQNNHTSLFEESETQSFLIPEKKKVDFLLKLDGEVDYEFIVKTIEKINLIPQVITSYAIETNTLKSKDFLIF